MFAIPPVYNIVIWIKQPFFNHLISITDASVFQTDTHRGLTAQQWARFCGRKFCSDAIGEIIKHQVKIGSKLNRNIEPKSVKTSNPSDGMHFLTVIIVKLFLIFETGIASMIRRILPMTSCERGLLPIYDPCADVKNVSNRAFIATEIPT